MTPKRIQRQRTKGWRMPEGAVYVGRPSRWGNPFRAGGRVYPDDPRWRVLDSMTPGGLRGMLSVTVLNRERAVEAYFQFIINAPGLSLRARDALGGHDLVCWCPLDQPCHADVLLELANA